MADRTTLPAASAARVSPNGCAHPASGAPEMPASTRGTPGRHKGFLLREQPLGDHHELDLVRALVDLGGLAEEFG